MDVTSTFMFLLFVNFNKFVISFLFISAVIRVNAVSASQTRWLSMEPPCPSLGLTGGPLVSTATAARVVVP